MTKPKIIFFGNGPLADSALKTLEKSCEIVFHARSREDLTEVQRLKSKNPALHGVLASYGVIIKKPVLDLFEPEGILNIHPSLLPEYRGPSPIETAIRDGKTTFGVSVMKLVAAMDAGPLYYQTALDFDKTTEKSTIYEQLATSGATWIANHLTLDQPLKAPSPQKGEPTFTKMLEKSLSSLDPSAKTAEKLHDEIRAYQGFPKSKLLIFGLDCTIIKTHVAEEKLSTPAGTIIRDGAKLLLSCKSGTNLAIDMLQPAGRKVMDAQSFLNGYAK